MEQENTESLPSDQPPPPVSAEPESISILISTGQDEQLLEQPEEGQPDEDEPDEEEPEGDQPDEDLPDNNQPEEVMEPETTEAEELEDQSTDPSNFLPSSVTTAIQSSIADQAKEIMQEHAHQFSGLQEQLSEHQAQLALLNQYARRGQTQNAFFKDGYALLNA